MKKPEIHYPCWWTYAIIGADEEDLRMAIGEVTAGTQHRVKFSRQSAEKHYVSLHIEVYVESEEQRNAVFDAFSHHEKIKFVL